MTSNKRAVRVGVCLVLVIVFAFWLSSAHHSRRVSNEVMESEHLSAILSTEPPQYLQIGEGKQEREGSLVKAKLELPFLGAIECLSAQYTVKADRLSSQKQTWNLFWTMDGNFVGADFSKLGFTAPPYDKQHIEDVYNARTERIVGLVKNEPEVKLSDLRGFVAEYASFTDEPNGIKRISIRRVLLSSEMWSKKEVYITTVWAKGILVTPSWSSDAGRMVIDSKGNGLFMDNGF